jgi:protein-tyrosine phosphatase
MAVESERQAPLRNAPNFRDLGGVVVADGRQVRTGLVYRSGVLDRLDDDDVDALAALGVRTIVDVRSDDEVAARPNRLPPGLEVLHRPITDVSAAPLSILEKIERGDTEGLGASMLIKGNDAFVRLFLDRFAGVVHLVADPQRWPVVVHCTAGKDRTGFAIACLLWAVGATDEAVLADYLRTNEHLAERHAEALAHAATRVPDVEPLRAMMEVRAEYLLSARAAIDDVYGSTDAFVRDGLGFDEASLARLRDALLEYPPGP